MICNFIFSKIVFNYACLEARRLLFGLNPQGFILQLIIKSNQQAMRAFAEKCRCNVFSKFIVFNHSKMKSCMVVRFYLRQIPKFSLKNICIKINHENTFTFYN